MALDVLGLSRGIFKHQLCLQICHFIPGRRMLFLMLAVFQGRVGQRGLVGVPGLPVSSR